MATAPAPPSDVKSAPAAPQAYSYPSQQSVPPSYDYGAQSREQGYSDQVPQGTHQPVDPVYQPQSQPAYVQPTEPVQTHTVVSTVAGHTGPRQRWINSFWSCCSPMDVACMSCWCPCIQFAKTQHRLKDPELRTYETVNPNCLIHFGLLCAGFSWAFQLIKRSEFREKFNVEGSGVRDCLATCCCPCCALVQEEKEVLLRTHGNANAPGGAAQGYQKNGGMVAHPA
ncbi:MAG: hypothetical protein M1823_005293 [Watsoniomyces obsoletus]|nr:MAG: hypothetical protein M1823_005293 [Watsoniomyces obsoletus]